MTERESGPTTLVFVRHGESEANVVQQKDKKGDPSGFTPEFRNKNNSEMRLTSEGVLQAQAAGEWIRKNINNGYFDGYYVSSFRRAQETAGHLHLPEGESKKVWKIRDYLREQGWGYFDNMPSMERDAMLPEIAVKKDRDKIYWAPLGGESMAELVFRTKVGIIHTLYRELSNGNGIVVSHGNLLWAVRIVMESLTTKEYERLDSRDNPLDKMHNCQILEYTRVDPENPKNVTDKFSWVRTVCPWDTSLSRNEWQVIQRSKFTNEDLLPK